MGTVGTILGDPEAVSRNDTHAELKTTEVPSAISLVVSWRSPRHLFYYYYYYLRCGKLKMMTMMMMVMIISCNSVTIRMTTT